jgi:hypothetical protein
MSLLTSSPTFVKNWQSFLMDGRTFLKNPQTFPADRRIFAADRRSFPTDGRTFTVNRRTSVTNGQTSLTDWRTFLTDWQRSVTDRRTSATGKRRQRLKFRGAPSENWTIILDSVWKHSQKYFSDFSRAISLSPSNTITVPDACSQCEPGCSRGNLQRRGRFQSLRSNVLFRRSLFRHARHVRGKILCVNPRSRMSCILLAMEHIAGGKS